MSMTEDRNETQGEYERKPISDDYNGGRSLKEKILSNPRPLTILFRYSVRRRTIKWATKQLASESVESYGKVDLAEAIGTPRQTFNEHSDVFNLFGIFRDDPERRKRVYAPNEDILVAFIDTNQTMKEEFGLSSEWPLFDLLDSEIKLVFVQCLIQKRLNGNLDDEWVREDMLNELGIPLQTWLRHKEGLLELKLFEKVGDEKGPQERYAPNVELVDLLTQLDTFLGSVFEHNFSEDESGDSERSNH